MNDLAANLRGLVEHYAAYSWLFAVWAVPLAVLCAAGSAVVRSAGPARSAHVPAGPSARGSWRASLAPADWLAVGALATFIALYALLVLYHEDLVGTDYAQLTATRFVDVPMWPESGRFFPLCLQEYNVIGLLGRSASLYHAFSLFELVVVVVCVCRILDIPVWLRCLTMIFILALPGVVQSFFGIVYPERDMILWLGLWIVCLRAFDRSGGRTAFCGALIAAQFLLYYKETAFILVGAFAGVRLLLAAWRDGRPLSIRIADFAARRPLEIAQLILCAVFLLTYYVVVGRHVHASYVAASASSPMIATAMRYARSDLLVDALVLAVTFRFVWLVRNRREPDLLWDPLAVAALMFALAYVKLGLAREYYLAPAAFVGALYLARFSYIALHTERRLTVAGAAVAAALVFGRNVSISANGILDRKEFVDGNVQLASFLTRVSRLNGRTGQTLFFPQIAGFQTMEFSAFLQYKGLRPAGILAAPGREDEAAFTVKSAHRYPDDLCQPSQAFRCVYEASPHAGDLVVLLPGREVSAADIQAVKVAGGEEVFRYRRRPTRVERALRSLAPSDRVELPVDAYVYRYP